MRLTDPNTQHPDHRIEVSDVTTDLWMSYVFNALLSLVCLLAIFASLRLCRGQMTANARLRATRILPFARRTWENAMAFHVKLANLRGSGQYGFAVVGEASYQDELEELAGGRTEESAEHYCSAELIPEPDPRASR